MAQHIGELDHVPAGFIKGPGKQMPQVVGENFPFGDPGFLAEGLHFRPDLFSGKVFAAFGEEDPAGSVFLLFGVLQELPAELLGQKDRTDLPF